MDLNLKGRLKRGLLGAELAKLRISREPNWNKDIFEDAPNVLFNPSEIQLNKQTEWNQATRNESNIGEQQFAGGRPTNLTIDLFFDTYEGVNSPAQSVVSQFKQAALGTVKELVTPSGLYPFFNASAVSVTEYTDRIRELTRIDTNLKRPPRCRLVWGKNFDGTGLIIEGYLKELSERFTLFLPDGTPVRAILTCTFEEYQPQINSSRENPGSSALDDDPTHIVRRGETLSTIAYQEYNDPSLWRAIAKANKIVNPRSLHPGQVLTIPVLQQSEIQGKGF